MKNNIDLKQYLKYLNTGLPEIPEINNKFF